MKNIVYLHLHLTKQSQFPAIQDLQTTQYLKIATENAVFYKF